MMAMKSRLRFALLIPFAALLGCTLPPAITPSTTATPLTGSWTNWQIQAGTAITSPPTGLYFVGAVQVQGTQSNAVFTTSGFGGPSPGTGTQVLDFSGTYSSSTGAVALYPAAGGPFAYAIGFNEPSVSNTVVPVGIVGGCVYPLNYTGVECLALIAINPAVGVPIASLTGTYVGTLTAAGAPTLSGAATLTVTQPATPNSSGQFPVSGTLAFPAGSGFGTVSLSGTIVGEGIALSDPSATPNSPSINFTASADPTVSQITVSPLTYSGSGTTATYTGTLTRH
jgi:hypothetical protein